jgi:hypothetical protein
MERNMSKELTLEAKEAMRTYFLKIIVLPGSVLSVVLFFFGYLVNDVANSRTEAAQSNAFAHTMEYTYSRIHELSEKAIEANMSAETAQKSAEVAQKKVIELLKKTEASNQESIILVDKIAKNEELSKSISDQGKVASIVTESLLINPKFKSDLLNQAKLFTKNNIKLVCKTKSSSSSIIASDKIYNHKVSVPQEDLDEGFLITGGGCYVNSNEEGYRSVYITKSMPSDDGNGWLCSSRHMPNWGGERRLDAKVIYCKSVVTE